LFCIISYDILYAVMNSERGKQVQNETSAAGHAGNLTTERVIERLRALEDVPTGHGSLSDLLNEVSELPRIDFERALSLVRELGVNPEPDARCVAGAAMSNLAAAYEARYGHIDGLLNLWVDLMSDGEGDASETAVGSFEKSITTGSLDPRHIATLVSVMAERLQGVGPNESWPNAP
jgi:hypothetical protein